MRLGVVGLSHHSAPIDVREAVAADEATWSRFLTILRERGIGEAMVLGTCNRVEIYGVLSTSQSVAEIESALAELRGLSETHRKHLYRHDGEAAVQHLFRVASSLDSMVVGESQILGQVKEAFAIAQQQGTIGPWLGTLVPRATMVARRVRNQTTIGESSVSVASVAVELGRQIFGDLKASSVLIVGAGKMGALAARHLQAAGCKQLLVCNRTEARGAALAAELGATARRWDELPMLLGEVDIVLCSTGAANPVVTEPMVKQAMKRRRGRWLFLLDIALPRDIDAAVGKIDNVYLYDVDALSEVAAQHLAGRRNQAQEGERIVTEEVARFWKDERARGLVPTIRALRTRFHQVAQSEVDRLMPRLATLPEREQKLVQQLAEQMVNKLLHAPQTALKAADPEEGLRLAEALNRLFALTDVSDHESGASTGAASPDNADEDAASTPQSKGTP